MEQTFAYVAEDKLQPELLCQHICFTPLVDPIVHNACENSFCRVCIEKTKWKCPLCGTGTENDFFKVNTRAFLNLLAQILVQCSQCQEQMQRGCFEEHKPKCPYECSHGCGTIISQATKTAHDATCKNVLVPCSAANLGCPEIVLRCILDAHTTQCKYEQSRWIVEPLNAKYDALAEKYEELLQGLNDLRTFVNAPPKVCKTVSQFNESVACGSGSEIQIWNVSTMELVTTLIGHTGAIRCLTQLSDGTLASGSDDTTVTLWDIYNSERKVFKGHTDRVNCILQLNNGYIASGSNDGTIRFWDISGRCGKTITVGSPVFALLQFDEDTIISASKCIEYWRVTSEKRIHSIRSNYSAISSIVKLDDGRLVTGGADKVIKVWENENCILELVGHTDWIRSIIKLDDGRIASCGDDKTIRIWNIETGKQERIMRNSDTVKTIAQIGDAIVSGGLDKIMKVWNEKCVEQKKLSGYVCAVAKLKM